ncbi:hypothetical protein [Azohydromonas australica]|uniref:hypothetical protein n=1 Tax=Azohydromonas australica TaxID=364039 RepID=UPI0003FC8FE3|nr:hypothetical protein [Azohydromonas australica]
MKDFATGPARDARGQPLRRNAPADALAEDARVPMHDAAGAAPGGGTPPDPWSDEEVVLLHWRLLQEVAALADPGTPLEAKLDTLRWVFTERDKDAGPFSFASCVRVAGCSPLSPIPYCGPVDVEEIRDRIRHGVRRWLAATLERYPAWVREAVARHPGWVEVQLARDPQWINEQVRSRTVQGDLFA